MKQTNNPFRGRLPAMADNRVVWPRWPVIIVGGGLERRGIRPPFPWSKASRHVDASGYRDAACYALPVFAQLLRLNVWWSRVRWTGEMFLWEKGFVNGGEGDYLHQLRPILPIRYWLRVKREWPRIQGGRFS